MPWCWVVVFGTELLQFSMKEAPVMSYLAHCRCGTTNGMCCKTAWQCTYSLVAVLLALYTVMHELTAAKQASGFAGIAGSKLKLKRLRIER